MDGRKVALWIALGLALGYSGAARSQEPVAEDDMKVRLERLEKQNQELMQALRKLQTSPASPPVALPAASSGLTETDVQKIVGNYLKEVEDKKAQEVGTQGGGGGGGAAPVPATQTEEGYRIGSLTGITAKWEASGSSGYGFWFKTANSDFTFHPGFWMQYDNVFFTQTPLTTRPQGGGAAQSGLVQKGNPQGIVSGPRLGGMGDFQDGTYFRRIRPFFEGTLWDTFEYRLILALENDQFSTSGLDEFWVGMNNIPIIGTIRMGHVKNALGLEADMTASSRTMTFLERSSYSEAIELNQNFVTGVWFGNAFLDQRTSYQFVVARPDQAAATGTFFGDGQWLYQGRLTGLPIWSGDGRCFTHVGVSGGWRAATNGAPGALKTMQLRARTEQRDDDPAGNPAGAQPNPNANDARMVDTGPIVGDHQWLTGLEFLSVMGPFSVQAEYGWNFVDNVRGVVSQGNAGTPAAGTLIPIKAGPQDFTFSGGYVQLSYILTGESRGYDKKLGTLSRDYFGSKGPFTNFWLTWGEDRRINWGWGAWELAARYSYLNLNDGEGLARIQGGILNGFTAGLNWYLNPSVKMQFEYVYDQRSDLPHDAKNTLGGTVLPGQVGGLGMRIQLSF
jgi:phosphate-selective porin OprO/OprP